MGHLTKFLVLLTRGLWVANYNPDIPDWKRRALADPSLKERQLEVLMHGPKSLTDAWFLQAMRYKYSRD
jgi:hypothetical protein